MCDRKEDMSVLVLLFIPVVIAVGGLVVNFNTVDIIYLVLVLAMFFKYCYKGKLVKNH